MSLIQWPFVRHSYTGLNNPLFVSDIQAANEAVIDGLIALAGLSPNDFFIISGLTYTAGINGNAGTYSEGIYYLNGVFYHIDDNLVQEGLFLLGSKADAFNEVFPDDGNSRPIYTIYNGTTLSTSVSGSTSIQMSGDMNGYRLNNKYLAQAIINLQNAYNSLGNAAKLNVGQTAGTVAAGDDSRLAYTKAQLDTMFATYALTSSLGNAAKLNVGQSAGTVAAGDDNRFAYTKAQLDGFFAAFATIANVLTLNNTTAFTPTADYQPATKQYVDGLSAKRLASGNEAIPDVPASGLTHTVPIGATLSDTNYIALVTIISESATQNVAQDVVRSVLVRNKQLRSFDVYITEPSDSTQNISLDWIIFGF